MNFADAQEAFASVSQKRSSPRDSGHRKQRPLHTGFSTWVSYQLQALLGSWEKTVTSGKGKEEFACVLSCFNRVQLCNPMDSSPPSSSVLGILQARIQERLAMPFSRGSSQPRD